MSLGTLIHVIFYTLFLFIVGMTPLVGAYLQKRKKSKK